MLKRTIKPILTLIILFFIFYFLTVMLVSSAPEAAPHFGVLDLTDADIKSRAVSIPASGWEYISESVLEPVDSLIYKLTVTAPREETYGFIIPNESAAPVFYINGSYQDIPGKNTLPGSVNTYYFTPRTNKMELLLQYLPADLASLSKNIQPADLIPKVVFGGERIIGSYTAKAFIFTALCAGFCLFCAFIGVSRYFMIYKKNIYIYYSLAALSTFFLFLFASQDFVASIIPVIDAGVIQKLYIVAMIVSAGLYIQFSSKLFNDLFNNWIVLGFSLYCSVCAVVVAFAPYSALNSIIFIFKIITAAIIIYIFIMLLMTQMASGSSVLLLWLTSNALIIAFLLGNVTNQIDDNNLIKCALITALGAGALCVSLTSPAINKRNSSPPEPASAFSEAMQIVNRLNYIKTQLLSNAGSNPAATGFNEISANPNMTRRPVGITEEEELRRDLKNISSEANRLSLLAQRMLNATYTDHKQLLGKVQLSKCAEKAYDLCSPMFEDKNNSFTLETEPWLPYVFGEEDMVMQVILHLLTNANDRTKNGTVTVHVSRGKNRKSVGFGIHDTGDIIEHEALAQLYSNENIPPQDAEIFGLYVARTILESMNGRLLIKSDIQTGTYLTFELPDWHEEEELNDK